MAQMIITPMGEELVLLSRVEYDRLAALATEAEEDAADVAAYDAAMAAIAAGREGPLPAAGHRTSVAQRKSHHCRSQMAGDETDRARRARGPVTRLSQRSRERAPQGRAGLA